MTPRSTLRAASLLLLVCCLVVCGGREPDRAGARVFEVTARGLTFEAPAEIPAGWTTFRFVNASPMSHFALIERLPEGYGIEEQQREIAPVFQQGMDLLAAGRQEDAMEKFGELPAWFGEIEFLGGPGMAGPGRTQEVTVFLEPGTYLLECYVKTDGIFHSYKPGSAYGMVHEFRVIPSDETGEPPAASLHLRLSSTGGIEMTGEPKAGEQTVEVQFVDQIVYENFVGHDVHLVRLTDDVSLERLEEWMDWRLPTGLQTPAPAQFLGGLNEMPAGSSGYLTVALEAGSYAWIAEVPGAMAKNMFRTFEVGGGEP